MTKKLAPEPTDTEPVTITAEDLAGVLNLYGAALFYSPVTRTVLAFAPVGMALARGLELVVDQAEVWHLVSTLGLTAAAARLTVEVRDYVEAAGR